MNFRLWNDQGQFHKVIRKGCWPLTAYSTWFLFHLAAAGKHLQQRSALALLGDTFEKYSKATVDREKAVFIAPVNFWSEALQQELITSEDGGQQGAITLAYATVESRHGSQIGEELKRLLRAVVLASKMGLKALDRDDSIEALSELAGLHLAATDDGIRLLQNEYNVLEWDENFKEFDILGDAVPRTQFLSFIRQRVGSSFDEAGKAKLFASKAAGWCDLLKDVDSDFAESHQISTREWHFQGETSNLEILPMQIKLAADRWERALQIDEPRGTAIYCYLEPSQDKEQAEKTVRKHLIDAAKDISLNALPILVILLSDEDGELGKSLAELAVMEESITEQERLKFGTLIPAHREKSLEIVRTRVDGMIKQRLYVTGFKDPLESRRLNSAATEIFNRIYKSPLVFPFDGFTTSRGNAADSCLNFTRELLLGKLDWNTVMSLPVKDKNRASNVLNDSWRIFAKNGNILKRPEHPVIRSLTEKWDAKLASGEHRLSILSALHEICKPPYGGNIASAGLFFGTFVAPRIEKLLVIRDNQQYAVAQWLQDDVFRAKFIDLSALHGVDLILLGDDSSEWETLIEEWEETGTHTGRIACLERAIELKKRVPIPPTLGYRYGHLQDQAETSISAIRGMEKRQDEAINKIENGIERKVAHLIAWGTAQLSDLIQEMSDASGLWTSHQISEMKPRLETARQEIIQVFPNWVRSQTPQSGSPDAVGDFKYKMLTLTGGNLKKLGLSDLYELLEKRTSEIIRNVETAADANQLIRDAKLWSTSHGDATRFIRVSQLRSLQKVGGEFSSKLQGMSRRIEMPELNLVRTQLSEMLLAMKKAEKEIVKRAEKLWNSKNITSEDIQGLLDEIEALNNAFENCDSDLEDLHIMRRALRIYAKGYNDLSQENISWPEFDLCP